MPYTQAYPLKESVQKALEAKIKLLQDRSSKGSDQATYYYTNRTPWITLTSAVDIVGAKQLRDFSVTDQSELAKKYKLTSGYQQESLPAGHGLSQELGIRPHPGIQNMNITSHNQFGSLRTAKVTFQVWSKEDLDACEILYMRPGMSVLLEWGWSLYLKGEGDNITVHPMEGGLDLFDIKKKTLIGVLGELQKLKETLGHGYDAIFGFVKNFSWKLRPDGGYDCSTDIVSPGELVESLNIAKPLTDDYAAKYNQYFEDKLIASKDALIAAPIEQGGYRTVYLSGGYVPNRGTNNSFDPESILKEREAMFQEALDLQSTVVNFKEQTSLSTLINWDLKYFTALSFVDWSEELSKYTKGIYYISMKDVRGMALLAKEFYKISNHKNKYHHVLLFNWLKPEYALNTQGQPVYDQGSLGVNAKERDILYSQYYVKLGYVLEFINQFALKSRGVDIVKIDVDQAATFSLTQDVTLSMDPSICMLPGDIVNVQTNNPITVARPIYNYVTQPPPATGLSPDTIKLEDSSNILDTYVNIEYLSNLINNSQISTFSKNGVPVARMLSFVRGLLSGISSACGGIMELDLQYFEHQGVYGVVDRQAFYLNSTPTFLDVLGLGSVFYGFDIQSILTPELASSIAISAQTSVTAPDASSANFLRFNKGIRDRVLPDRVQKSSVVNPKEVHNSSDEELSRIPLLYNAIYGALGWIPNSFAYAKELYSEYVNENFTQIKGSAASKVVIPFSATFQLDGTSGFNILNSFRVDENLFPYSYNEVEGGIGLIVTGLEATVDPSKWVTRIVAQMYPMASGNAKLGKGIGITPPVASVLNNYVVVYSNSVASLTDTSTAFATTGSYTRKIQNDISNLSEKEWKNWDKGDLDDKEDLNATYNAQNYTLVNGQDALQSNQQRYWKQIYGTNVNPWVRPLVGTLKGASDNQPSAWSAVFVSYIMSKSFPSWPYKQLHYDYVTPAKEARLNGATTGWVMYSMKYDTNIVAEAGDVIVSPRDASYLASHGSVVMDVITPDNILNKKVTYNDDPTNLLPIYDIKQIIEESGHSGAFALHANGNASGDTVRIRTLPLSYQTLSNGVTYPFYSRVVTESYDKQLIVLKYLG